MYSGNGDCDRALTVAASSQEEKDKWMEDLTATIQTAREKGDNKLQYLSLKSCSKYSETWSLHFWSDHFNWMHSQGN